MDVAPASAVAAFAALTVEAEKIETPPVQVFSCFTDVEPPSPSEASEQYGRIARMRERGLSTQPLPAAPEPQPTREALTADADAPAQEPGEEQVESVDFAENAVGRRLFRRKQDG